MNIAEILKNVPEGTELYSPICGEAHFEMVASWEGTPHYITVRVKESSVRFDFLPDGRYTSAGSGECLLFPSKDCRDWEKFAKQYSIKEGEPVMVSDNGKNWSLRYHHKGKLAYKDGGKCGDSLYWSFIVPVKGFNFNDPESNIEKSI